MQVAAKMMPLAGAIALAFAGAAAAQEQVVRIGHDSQLGGTLGRYVAQQIKAKKFAMIDDRTACGQGLAQEFMKSASGSGVELYAPYVYDAVMVMVEAMKKAGSAEPAKHLPTLAKIKYKEVIGDIEFDAKGDMKHGTLTLYTYKGGKRQQLAVVR